MSLQKTNLLPLFGNLFELGNPGTVTPFYLERDVAKSGYITRGDWIDDTLSVIQTTKISSKGFPIKGGTVFEIATIDHRDRAHLIFPSEVSEGAVHFWRALVFLCTGRFFSKQVFLGNENPSLSHQDHETLSRLQYFFSFETSFGEEKCNMLFDTDRRVIIVRGDIGNNVLQEPFSFPELKDDYEGLKRMVAQFLNLGYPRLTDQEWEERTAAVRHAVERYENLDIGAIAREVADEFYKNKHSVQKE